MAVKKKRAKRATVPSTELQELIDGLELTEEQLPSALLNQSQLYLRAGRYRVAKLKRRAEAEEHVKVTRVSVATETRQRDDIKITENTVAELTESDPRVRKAKHDFNEARALEEFSKLLLDAYQMRANSCRALVQLLGAQAANESGLVRAQLEEMGLHKMMDKLEKNYPGRQ